MPVDRDSRLPVTSLRQRTHTVTSVADRAWSHNSYANPHVLVKFTAGRRVPVTAFKSKAEVDVENGAHLACYVRWSCLPVTVARTCQCTDFQDKGCGGSAAHRIMIAAALASEGL